LCLPRLGIRGRALPFQITAHAKQRSPHHCQFYKALTGPWLHVAFRIPYVYDFITELCRQKEEVIQGQGNMNARNIGQGEAEH
jgi:hypothetical protein